MELSWFGLSAAPGWVVQDNVMGGLAFRYQRNFLFEPPKRIGTVKEFDMLEKFRRA